MFDRPKLHFTSQKGWINDPNGLIRVGDQYHLFAQHHPDDVCWGPMHWLHATSKDLLNWHEEGIALYPDARGTIFSGSAAQLPDGRIVLAYTEHGECEQQCIAFSDDGIHFEKYAGNPVITNPGYPDFRDPKLFWNDKRDCWSMVVAAGEKAEFYASSDLIHWEKTGAFGPEPMRFGDVFECTDCIRLPGPDGRERWVLTASMYYREPGKDRWMRYCVGEFDGDTFHMTEQYDKPLDVDNGYDSYAGVTFFGIQEPTFMTWMTGSSCPMPTPDYCGSLSIPRTLALLQTDEGLRLAQRSVLRDYALVPAKNGQGLVRGPFVIEVEADAPFTLSLCGKNPDDFLHIRLTADHCIETERSKSAHFAPDAIYNRDAYRKTRVPRLRKGATRLQVICDSWCIEVFADDGLYTHSLVAFAEDGFGTLEWTGEGQVAIAENL